MRHPPRPAIELRIKALDQHDLLRNLAISVVPLVLPVRADRIRFSATVGVDERHGDEVGVWDRKGVGDGEGVFVDGLDGPPDVDDLVAGC